MDRGKGRLCKISRSHEMIISFWSRIHGQGVERTQPRPQVEYGTLNGKKVGNTGLRNGNCFLYFTEGGCRFRKSA